MGDGQMEQSAIWAAWWLPQVLNILIFLTGVFLILLVLIQRGKGGGLAGAFGGAGGSSAFGSRAGDKFTRVTIYVAAFWIILTMLMVRVIQPAEKPTGADQSSVIQN
jgi:preprotein translocase subunit SecG